MVPPTPSTAAPRPQLRRWQQALLWAVVLAVLLGVFALYTQPEFIRTVADQVWACF